MQVVVQHLIVRKYLPMPGKTLMLVRETPYMDEREAVWSVARARAEKSHFQYMLLNRVTRIVDETVLETA